MSSIDNIFNKYSNYIIGFYRDDSNYHVDIKCSSKWRIKPGIITDDMDCIYEKIDQEKKENGDVIFTLRFSSPTMGFDSLFKIVEDMINYNLELENKQKLFNDKVAKLKEVFNENDYKTLSTLTFTFEEDVDKQPVENNEQETEYELDS